MDIYVLDKNFNAIDVIDTYTSVIWSTRYYSPGDFELYLPATDKLIQSLQKDFYLCRDKDISGTTYKNVMIIENLEIKTDVEDKNYIIATGRDLKSILNRRIIWQQTSLSGKVESCIRQLINENVINPMISSRKISNFSLSDIVGLPSSVEIQFTGDNLGESIEKLCKEHSYGYDVQLENGNFVFYLYTGEDRSYSQGSNPYVVFSPEFENLLTTDYKRSSDTYKNTALVAGEGEGLERRTTSIGESQGLDRYEMYVDARDVSSNDGQFSDAEYNNMLSSRGTEELAKNSLVESFEGSTETRLSYTLNSDYFLGDVVQVINEYGISATPRILEIIESEDENGKTIIPTFSTLEV